MHDRTLSNTGLRISLGLIVLLLVGCVPIQPAANGASTLGAVDSSGLTWQGAPLSDATACGQLQITGAGEATMGPCGEVSQTQALGAHAQEWAAIQQLFAPFTYTMDTTTLTFTGRGDREGAAWQRGLAAWAQLIYSELTAGRTSAAVATAMSWFVGATAEQPELCQHVTVLVYGYAYAETVPCAGGNVQETVGGWLTDAEMVQFDQWLYGYAPLYAEDNYLAGVGAQSADEVMAQQVAAWAEALYARLTAGDATALPAVITDWQPYQADSGYRVAYPLAFYSMRAGLSGPTVLHPGVRVVEPNDAFVVQERMQTVYKLSIAVSTNEQGLSMAQPAALLANSAFYVYDPALLADHSIQSIQLDGVPALRVDDLAVGPTTVATQIVALHNAFIYELIIEPHVLTTNQALPWVETAPNQTNRALIDQVVATFHFTD